MTDNGYNISTLRKKLKYEDHFFKLATKGSTLEEDALLDAGNAPLALCQAACQQQEQDDCVEFSVHFS